MNRWVRNCLFILVAGTAIPALAIDEYRIDDGVKESGIGIQSAGSNSIAWLNHFTVQPGLETISAVRVSFGGGLAGNNIANGTALTVYIWDDPNQDGDPADAAVLASAAGNVAGTGTNSLSTYPLSITLPPGRGFFAGVIINYSGQVQVASIDYDGTDTIPAYPPNLQSWLAGSANGTAVDPNALALAQLPVDRVSNVLPGDGNWMIRLNAVVALPAAISITPNPLNFGQVVVGVLAGPRLVTLTSTGIGNLNIASISNVIAPFSLQAGGSCPPSPFSLSPGAACTLAYYFRPAALGPAAQIVTVQSNAPSSPDSFSMNGEGIASDPVLAPATLSFGEIDIDTASSIDMTVFNPGVATLDVSSYTISGSSPPAFFHSGGSCGPFPFSLGSGLTCTMTFSFLPLHQGQYIEQAQLISNASAGSGIFMLDGTGVIFDHGFEPY